MIGNNYRRPVTGGNVQYPEIHGQNDMSDDPIAPPDNPGQGCGCGCSESGGGDYFIPVVSGLAFLVVIILSVLIFSK